MQNIVKTAGVLIFEQWKVLLVCHTPKAEHITWTYGIPAGRFQENETALQCACRELQEETGLFADEKDLIALPKTYIAKIERKRDPITVSLETFLCKKYSWTIKTSEENIPERIAIKEIQKIRLLPNIESIIKDGLSIA